jgi:hypothetical protein
MNGRRSRLVVGSLLIYISTALGVGPLHPADPPLPPLSDAAVKKQKWVAKEMLEAYDKVGNHDPKWDEPARLALRLSVDMWGAPRAREGGNWVQFQAAQRAIDAGCDDPMVLYVYARTFVNFGHDPEKCRRLHNRAADALRGSHYSGFYKSLSQFRAAQLQIQLANEHGRAMGKYDMDELNAGTARLSLGIGMMSQLSREINVPVGEWIDLGGEVLSEAMIQGGGRTIAVEWALPEIAKRAPKLATLVIKGHLYTKWAWDARGTDFAGKVTDNGWKLMKERLEVAHAALEEAWQLDPTCVEIPIQMITVELGQGQGRDRMEMWFKRAMEIDPDSQEACRAKLYYLEPKWYGTPRDCIAFGRECLKTGRFNSNVPWTLERAHAALSHYTHGGYDHESDPSYYSRPGVWADLKQVFDGYLAADKDLNPNYLRNQYARYACLAEAWDDAAKMFPLIGEQVDPRVWKAEGFQAARKAALANAAAH